eukprot:12056-Heterococcus_DN1.PRE.1
MAAAAPLVSEDSSRAAASAGGSGSGNDSSRADSRADAKAAAATASGAKKASKRQRAPPAQVMQQSSQELVVERPTARYSDLGGITSILQEVRELIEYPLTHPEVYAHLGIEPPRGILLHGPPGCVVGCCYVHRAQCRTLTDAFDGHVKQCNQQKLATLLANAIAGELGVSFVKISAPEIVSGMSGESEQKVRELFASAAAAAPCIVFIDEVDAITAKRET